MGSSSLWSLFSRTKAGEVAMGRNTDRKGKRKSTQGERGAERPKCLDYKGKTFWRKGSTNPGLESSGRDAGRT